jgi:pectinesterase
VTLCGDPGETENTVITLDTNVGSVGRDGKKLTTPESATVLVRGDAFRAENLTFENTTTRAQKIQALAFYITGDRAVLRHCTFLGWQDTVRADAPRGHVARQYFADCTIEGYVDFIYAAGTAVFDRCHIHCRGDGYITAASTAQNNPFGFVFLDCRVTAAPDVQRTYLGRPWRPYAATAFLRTELPAAVSPAGWDNWGNTANEHTARYAEYQSRGPGARPDQRVSWAHQLTDAEAARYTPAAILAGSDGWNPTADETAPNRTMPLHTASSRPDPSR